MSIPVLFKYLTEGYWRALLCMLKCHRLSLLLASMIVGSVTAAGQFTISLHPDGPDYLAPDAPFTLTRTTRLETRLQNGSYLTHEGHERVTRDARGRVFDLITPVLSDPLAQPVKSYLLGDPLAHTVTQWSSSRNLALQTALPVGARLQFGMLQQTSIDGAKLPKSVATTTEDLGSQEIAGLQARGTRTTTLIPVNLVGNSTPLRYVTEVWISSELHIPLRELDQNPLSGTRTMNTEKVEPNAGGDALFHLPPGLEVRTVTPPVHPGVHDAEQIAYTKALDDLKAPESREAAGDVVVSYAQKHDEVAAHAAHMLAIHGTHLAEAKSLAEGAVSRMEQTTATIALDSVSPGSFAEMISLAQAWDALGSVYAANGDAETAKRLFHCAWRIGGRGMTLDRLAQLEAHNNDKATALHDDLVALGGDLDAHDTDEISRRAERLGDPQPSRIADPESILGVPDPGKLRGDARFDLLFSSTGVTAVSWLDGSPELKALVPTLTALKFPVQVPDTGPEHVLRRIHLTCRAQDSCDAVFLYAWQAKQANPMAASHPD